MAVKIPQLNPDYATYTTHRGEELTIHTVPTIVINSIKTDTPKPKRPKIVMTTKAGKQERFAKAGDPEWDEYQAELEVWAEAQDNLTEAVTKVLSLRSYKTDNTTLLKIPANKLEFPEYYQELVEAGLIVMPTNEWQIKAMWVDSVVLSQQDEVEIGWILRKLNGVPEDLIEQMKSSFRDTIYGKITGDVGRGDEEAAEGQGDSSQ